MLRISKNNQPSCVYERLTASWRLAVCSTWVLEDVEDTKLANCCCIELVVSPVPTIKLDKVDADEGGLLDSILVIDEKLSSELFFLLLSWRLVDELLREEVTPRFMSSSVTNVQIQLFNFWPKKKDIFLKQIQEIFSARWSEFFWQRSIVGSICEIWKNFQNLKRELKNFG